ncbi:beta strand repeat-containing protein [Variovorax terrae]|uniref:Filamentous hemagglutinin N-terminal domain-containing protein n=1 Tax=Variovorax terrae TaxID=2923278 RepID=A0A9X1VT79_9BURK|nr:filamentous hemagglutinin N-terminal domain-containing protein [Variovorax terrae]MCJ0763421.1 filamentous hemagglutinin N-terminal domain-containing protein [Variovorax terrae]
MKTTPSWRHHLLAAAVFAACQPAGAQLAPNALPTGGTVSAGQATFTTQGSVLRIDQATQRAIINFNTFDIGASAKVNVSQPNAASALLARTLSANPSQIQGQLQANGAVWLVNPAGILVGPNARIDVGQFVATTLKVNDGDFLAGRLTFGDGSAATGAVRNLGDIRAASGGSVYLVGADVENAGTITAPGGSVALAAGKTVQIMDTATPGVSVQVTGGSGTAANLGRITAEAGRIGLAGALVRNEGTLDASSLVREGGRIFLRATQDVTTSATSRIAADGTTGGRVELYAERAARIDGDVSATGSAGPGGFVDTSGRQSLDVVRAPQVGKGGEWLIDPITLLVMGDADEGVSGAGTPVITSSENGARVRASTISSQLDAGVNVTLTTGGATPGLGDIFIYDAITKTAGGDATLRLNAYNNTYIQAPITSSSGKLNLTLNNTMEGAYGITSVYAPIDLNGGNLTITEGSSASRGAAVVYNGGSINLNGGTVWARYINVVDGGSISSKGGTLDLTEQLGLIGGTLKVDSGTLAVAGGLGLRGTVEISPGATLAVSGNSSVFAGSVFRGGDGNMSFAGTLYLDAPLTFGVDQPTLTLNNVSLSGAPQNALVTSGNAIVAGAVSLTGQSHWQNTGAVTVEGDGKISVVSESAQFSNAAGAKVVTSGTVDTVLQGAGGNTFSNEGTLEKTSTGQQHYAGISNSAGSQLLVSGGTLGVSGNLFGSMETAAGTTLNVGNAVLSADSSFTGAGSLRWSDHVSLTGPLTLAATAPALTLAANTVIHGGSADNVLTTRNAVSVTDGQVTLADSTAWHNEGALTIGGGSTPARLDVGAGTALNNASGSSLSLLSNGTLAVAGTLQHDAGATWTGGGGLSVAGGGVTLTGSAAMGRLEVSGGTLQATGGLNVTDAYSQAGGTVQLANAALNQSAGDLVVGSLTAQNLLLRSQSGAVRQTTGTSLGVTGQLVASAATGIALGSTTNELSQIAANNRGSGGVALASRVPTSLYGVTTDSGNITVAVDGSLDVLGTAPSMAFIAALPGTAVNPATESGFSSSGAIRTGNGTVALTAGTSLDIRAGVGVSSGGGAISMLARNGLLNVNAGASVNSGSGSIDLTSQGPGAWVNAPLSVFSGARPSITPNDAVEAAAQAAAEAAARKAAEEAAAKAAADAAAQKAAADAAAKAASDAAARKAADDAAAKAAADAAAAQAAQKAAADAAAKAAADAAAKAVAADAAARADAEQAARQAAQDAARQAEAQSSPPLAPGDSTSVAIAANTTVSILAQTYASQTTGGSPGSFGGSTAAAADSTDTSNSANGDSKKPSSKDVMAEVKDSSVAKDAPKKMYCN